MILSFIPKFPTFSPLRVQDVVLSRKPATALPKGTTDKQPAPVSSLEPASVDMSLYPEATEPDVQPAEPVNPAESVDPDAANGQVGQNAEYISSHLRLGMGSWFLAMREDKTRVCWGRGHDDF